MDKPIYNNWNIVSTIGQGSFGKVYLVERKFAGFSEKAALKVITIEKSFLEGVEDLSEKERNDADNQKLIPKTLYGFLDEIRTALQLSKGCSNIVCYRDYQIFEDDSKVELMVLMDLLVPLRKYFSSGRIHEKTIIKLGIDICHALTYLERHAIIHRDVKPDNIFVNDRDNFILGDFGAAANVNDRRYSRIGTLNYIAPEVYAGEQYSHSIDIYALGLVLFRFLNCGLPPFLDKESLATPVAIREAVERRLSGEIPKLNITNQSLSNCVLKAIHPIAEKRYHTAEEFRKDLVLAYKETSDAVYLQSGSVQHAMKEDDSTTVDLLNSTNQNYGFDSSLTSVPKVVFQEERSNATSKEAQKVQLNLLIPNSMNELSKMSDADLSHLLETSVCILSDRAFNGNHVAKKKLVHIHQITEEHLSTPAEEYRRTILNACRRLLNNSSYSSNSKENEMNDFIRDVLSGNCITQDQTRQGRSVNKKDAGEIDIVVTYNNNEPVLIEGLKTGSLNQAVIKNHIGKLMLNYDPIGVYGHFLLVYFTGQQFDQFTQKMIAWLKKNRIMDLSFDNVSLHRHHTFLAEIGATCTRDARQEELVIIIVGICKNCMDLD